MDHKPWLWRKKSTERAILTKNKSDILKEKEEKIAQLERSLQGLGEELSFAHAECFEKEAILAKQAKVAEEAILGWEKAEAEAISVKTELYDILHQKAAVEQRICQLDDALNVTMVERELLIRDAAEMISCEQAKVQKLEEHVAEKEKLIAGLDDEYGKLSEILAEKEKIILELTESNQDLVVNLESAERSNSSLRYEVCMLQKQLDIRSEERKCNLKSADASHKQHLGNVRRIAKLEEECKRLRSMLSKRLPGPAAVAKMRSEVETLGNNTTRESARNFNSRVSFNSFASHGSSPLNARLHVKEDEHNAMKESLSIKDSELQLSRTMLACTTSKLSQVEAQLEKLSRGQAAAELVKNSPTMVDNLLSSITEDGCDEDNVSCSGSWASALISELENLKKGKVTTPCKSTRASDLSFMDDFEAIEKLAMLCDDKPAESSDPKREAIGLSAKEMVSVDIPTETTNDVHQCKIEKGLLKLIELTEGIIQRSSKEYTSIPMISSGSVGDRTDGLTGYVARAFLWKTSELTCTLQSFATVCNGVLDGNTSIERFVLEVNLVLDWVISHCFSLRDVSDMREDIIEHLELDSSAALKDVAVNKQIENQATYGTDELRTQNRGHKSLVSASKFTDITGNDTHHVMNKMSVPKFQDSEGNSSGLRTELNTSKETGINEHGKYESTSTDNVNKGNQQGYHSLESKRQLECYPTKEGPKYVTESEEKHLKMLTASQKLIECQETILNLGKQLKSLTSPKDDVILCDKLVRSPFQPSRKPRSQSLNEILAEDNVESDYLCSPQTKEIICTEARPPHERKLSGGEGGGDSATCASHPVPVVRHTRPYGTDVPCDNEADVKAAAALAVVPSKRKGNTNLLKRILVGRRKEAMMKPKVVMSA